MKDILEKIVDNIGWVIAAVSFMAAWLEQRPWAQRRLVNFLGKWLVKKGLKITRKYRGTFLNEDQELRLCERLIEILNDLVGIMKELGFNVKPKAMKLPLEKRSVSRYQKKQIKQTFKERQQKMKQRNRETIKRLRDNLKAGGITLLIGLMALTWCIDTPAVELIDPEPITAQFKLFPKPPRTGILWDMDDWSEHSQVSFSILGWKDILFADFGLVNFEQIETSGEHWWTSLNPSGGITLDIVEAAERWPLIEPYVSYVPDFVYISAGYYIHLEHPHEGSFFISAGLSW